MSALFVRATPTYISNALPAVVDFPFTVGLWAYMTAPSATRQTLFCMTDSGSPDNYLAFGISSSELPEFYACAGGTESINVFGSVAMVAGVWQFYLVRFSGPTSRSLHRIDDAGLHQQLEGTVSRAPTGMDTITLGALQKGGGISVGWDGRIAEYWLINRDVFFTAGGISSAVLIRQLARHGPFSVPAFQNNLVDYRSLRVHPTLNIPGEILNRGPIQTWAETGGVTTAGHVPLPYTYVKPRQVKNPMMI